MGILVDAVDAGGIEERGTTLDPMNLVSLGQQERSEIGTVLPGNTCDKRFLQSFDLPDALRPGVTAEIAQCPRSRLRRANGPEGTLSLQSAS